MQLAPLAPNDVTNASATLRWSTASTRTTGFDVFSRLLGEASNAATGARDQLVQVASLPANGT